MAVHDIRAGLFQELRQPLGEWQIQVARTKQILHTNFGQPRDAINARVGRTNKRVVMAPITQRVDQVHDLLWAAQEMAPGFDMQYFHAPMILYEAVTRAIPNKN